MLAPVFALIMAGIVDLGMLVHTRIQLNSAISAGSNYALINGDSVTSAEAGPLAQKIAVVLSSGRSVDSAVRFNHASPYLYSGAKQTTAGSASTASNCYCPTKQNGAVAFGASMTCGAVCSNGSVAGKFVEIEVSRNYTPIFSGLGIVNAGDLKVSALVQAK